jgi:anti-sigma factor RsiW
MTIKRLQHLSNDLLVRFLDDELPPAETSVVEQHLNGCAECRHRYHRLGGISKSIENFVCGISPQFSDTERSALLVLLNTDVRPRPPQKVLRHFAWGMALAASLALGLIIAPQFRHTGLKTSGVAEDAQQSASLLEVDGETFVPLPYSNPDLPATPHIVQMQVPVSSLTDAGVHFEAISNEVSSGDESVLADVLLGIDGQPLGVHVLSVE